MLNLFLFYWFLWCWSLFLFQYQWFHNWYLENICWVFHSCTFCITFHLWGSLRDSIYNVSFTSLLSTSCLWDFLGRYRSVCVFAYRYGMCFKLCINYLHWTAGFTCLLTDSSTKEVILNCFQCLACSLTNNKILNGKVQFSRCKHAIINVNIHHTSIFREKIDFPQVGIELTPVTCQVSAPPVRPPETISSPIAQQELYAYKFHILHDRVPSAKIKYKQGYPLAFWTVRGVASIPTWGKSSFSLKMDVWWILAFIIKYLDFLFTFLTVFSLGYLLLCLGS